MATSCAIGLQEKDGVMTTFCICDGYLDVAKLAYDRVMENQGLSGIIGVPEMMLDSEGKKKTVIDNYRREVKKFSREGSSGITGQP